MRIGILTGGGDCPGLNAVIRAAVKTAIVGYGYEAIGIEDGFDGLLGSGKTRNLALPDVRGILPKGGTMLGTSNRGNPFAVKMEIDGKTVIRDASGEAIRRLDRLGLDALVVVGGDGTLRIARELFFIGVPVVGVPKTIDNDLAGTDLTFGFDTAVATATDAIDKLHTTAESHHRVMVVEVMGRDAGWIALHSGLAGGADAILIPEIPYGIEKVCQAVLRRDAAGHKFSLVVAAEGANPKGGQQVFQSPGDLVCQPRLGGIGAIISQQVQEITGRESRVVVLGHLQRGGSPTPFDRLLATRFGAAAIRAIADGDMGTMVALRGGAIATIKLVDALREPKRVNPEGDTVRTAREMGITFG